MIPDPPTAGTPLVEGGSAPAPDPSGDRSGAGHLCAGCGQTLEAWTRDLWCFASETTVAYWPCLLEAAR